MNDRDIAQRIFFEGVAYLENENFGAAESSFIATLKLAPRSIPTLNNLAAAQYKQNKIDDAAATSKKAVEIDPENIDAHFMLATCQRQRGANLEALATCDKLISINPALAEAHCNRGYILSQLRKYEEALSSFDRAISIQPNFVEAHSNRASALRNLDRYDEALAAYDKVLTFKPDLADAWCGRGNVYGDLQRFDEALAAYDKALRLKPDSADAWLGRGNIFADLQRFDDAIAAYDKVLALKPDSVEAWNGRGTVYTELKDHGDAFAAYDKALALKPDSAEAWVGRGNVFYDLKRYDDAFAAYDKACGLKPDLISVEGHRLYMKMQLCDWKNFDIERAHLISSIKQEKAKVSPFPLLAVSSSPDDKLQCAKIWVANKHPPSRNPAWRGERYNHRRIRVAYLSADFRVHAVSSLTVGMFEAHDKSRFDVTALSIGDDDKSELHQRLKASFEHFIDAKTYADDRLAGLIKELEIDILVDLMGFTEGSRTNVLARRPAPIQINYLGYLGTMGTPYMDYIVADRTVIPENQHDFYSEKVVYLPNSFQPTDQERRIADKIFTRAEVGLPQDGFVFCSFNNSYKITPDVFDIWMRILKRVDGSVLWLVGGSPAMERNLRSEAAARGVEARRLVFAQRLPLPEYQARLRLADLFLDTLPYNAGATASDALWAGLPVLTRIGDTFVGRMAASVLTAIDLPELITTTSEAYEQMAFDLATQPKKLAAIKRKLAENRLATPLFDTKLYTKHIEAAYMAMYERFQAGLAPDHISIPN